MRNKKLFFERDGGPHGSTMEIGLTGKTGKVVIGIDDLTAFTDMRWYPDQAREIGEYLIKLADEVEGKTDDPA